MAKKSKTVGHAAYKPADNYILLDLRYIVSNTEQPRTGSRDGAIPNLNAAGYGLFEPLPNHPDKKPIWKLLTSNDANEMAQGIALIDQYETDLKELADSITVHAQLHNIGVRPVEGTENFDVIYGMGRSLACAYNYARSAGELAAVIKAEIAVGLNDPNDAFFRALAENKGRRAQTVMDESDKYHQLKKQGFKLDDIAKRSGVNSQRVRNLLQLQRCTDEEKAKLRAGTITQKAAFAELEKREKGSKPEQIPEAKKDRKRMPTLIQAKKLYSAAEKPEDMNEEMWKLWTSDEVRRFLAYYIDVPFTSHADMIKAIQEKEKAALSAEAVQQAAEEAEDQQEVA